MIKTQLSTTPRVPTVGSAPWIRRDCHWLWLHAPSYFSAQIAARGCPMTFDGTTTFAESSVEQVAVQNTQKLGDERGTASRKHFLEAYAEHLEALKRGRSTK